MRVKWGSLTHPWRSDVTPMSGSGRVLCAHPARNSRESHVESRVARRVQALGALVQVLTVTSLATASVACVIPPPIEVETGDAGVNAPPVIIAAADESGFNMQPPTLWTVNRLAPGTFDVTVYDVDAEDALTIQMFLDYTWDVQPAPSVTCIVPPPTTSSPTRTQTCSANVCPNLDGAHRLEIEVYDRPPILEKPFRTMPDTNGLSSTWTLDLNCASAPTST